MKNVNNEFTNPALAIEDIETLTQGAPLALFTPRQVLAEFAELREALGLLDTAPLPIINDADWEALMLKIAPFLSQQSDTDWIEALSLHELEALSYQHHRVLGGLRRLDEANPAETSPSGILLPFERSARIEMLLATASAPLAWVKGIHLF